MIIEVVAVFEPDGVGGDPFLDEVPVVVAPQTAAVVPPPPRPPILLPVGLKVTGVVLVDVTVLLLFVAPPTIDAVDVEWRMGWKDC